MAEEKPKEEEAPPKPVRKAKKVLRDEPGASPAPEPEKAPAAEKPVPKPVAKAAGGKVATKSPVKKPAAKLDVRPKAVAREPPKPEAEKPAPAPEKKEPEKKEPEKKPAKKPAKKREKAPPEKKKPAVKEKKPAKKKAEKEEEGEEAEEEEEEHEARKKPELADAIRAALRERRAIARRRPTFYRQEWYRHPRLGLKWRKPQGGQSKLRRHLGYRINVVSIGFRGPKPTRGLHPSGFREILVHTVTELKGVDPKTQAVRIAGGVGGRKRQAIQEEADGLGIRILNRREE